MTASLNEGYTVLHILTYCKIKKKNQEQDQSDAIPFLLMSTLHKSSVFLQANSKDNCIPGSCEHWKLNDSIKEKSCKDSSPLSVLIPAMSHHVKGLVLDQLPKGGDFCTPAIAFPSHSKKHAPQSGRTSALPGGRT